MKNLINTKMLYIQMAAVISIPIAILLYFQIRDNESREDIINMIFVRILKLLLLFFSFQEKYKFTIIIFLWQHVPVPIIRTSTAVTGSPLSRYVVVSRRFNSASSSFCFQRPQTNSFVSFRSSSLLSLPVRFRCDHNEILNS